MNAMDTLHEAQTENMHVTNALRKLFEQLYDSPGVDQELPSLIYVIAESAMITGNYLETLEQELVSKDKGERNHAET